MHALFSPIVTAERLKIRKINNVNIKNKTVKKRGNFQKICRTCAIYIILYEILYAIIILRLLITVSNINYYTQILK